MLASRSKGDGNHVRRVVREQAEKLKRSPAPTQPQPEKQDRPERKPQEQPDPVPV
jgi:hypothetical protein